MNNTVAELYYEGFRYYYGEDGYPLNYYKAYEFFQKAADLGDDDSMNYLGMMYEDGEGVPLNHQIAFNWYYRAVQTNPSNYVAAYNLGRAYYAGMGVAVDAAKAFEVFSECIELVEDKSEEVYSRACYFAGCIQLEHFNNQKKAYPYFLEAANHGAIAEAWYNLGFLCEKGAIPVSEPGKAARDGLARQFYQEAANLGLAEAMDSLGRLYASYDMIPEATRWLKLAISNGYEPSKKRLQLLNLSQSFRR